MPFADKGPSQITKADILALIGNEPEGRIIDYKRDLIGNSDGDKKEFLYDISSFANTQGGYLVIGVEERGGIPSKIVGLANVNTDNEISALRADRPRWNTPFGVGTRVCRCTPSQRGNSACDTRSEELVSAPPSDLSKSLSILRARQQRQVPD
jgi:hypothetical protein